MNFVCGALNERVSISGMPGDLAIGAEGMGSDVSKEDDGDGAQMSSSVGGHHVTLFCALYPARR